MINYENYSEFVLVNIRLKYIHKKHKYDIHISITLELLFFNFIIFSCLTKTIGNGYLSSKEKSINGKNVSSLTG